MSSESTLSRILALRISVAARVLPDTDPSRLVNVLVDAMELPFTEKKFKCLTMEQLRDAASGELKAVPLPTLKLAMDYLKGKRAIEVCDDSLPTIQPYADGEMPGSLRIAVASNEGEKIDGHFGSCRRFLVYQVALDEIRLIAIRTPESHESDKNSYRAGLISDCSLLYTLSIGGPAAAKVVKVKIHPVKFPNGGEAREALAKTQRVLHDNPPPWLAKALAAGKARP